MLPADIDTVMDIYDAARQRMRKSGNLTQWANGYPSPDVIMQDILSESGFVVQEDDGRIVGAFTFVTGKDPTYEDIDGQWLNDDPYGTIHRIAGLPDAKGIADTCLAYCRSKGMDIRVDTHEDNTPMLGWIASRGFKYCGIIICCDGTPRKAFQLTMNGN